MDAASTYRDLPSRGRPRALGALAASAALLTAVAALGGLATRPAVEGWYRTLEKPWFNPPDWVFGPVWTVLYAVLAVVGWQIWRTPVTDDHEAALRRRALVAFAVQLVLNLA